MPRSGCALVHREPAARFARACADCILIVASFTSLMRCCRRCRDGPTRLGTTFWRRVWPCDGGPPMKPNPLKATRARTALQDTFLRNAPVGFAVIDAAFRFVQLNNALAAANGAAADDHIGRTIL